MQCNASTKAPSEGSDVLALGNINGGHAKLLMELLKLP